MVKAFTVLIMVLAVLLIAYGFFLYKAYKKGNK
ncbi:hypothetical protein METH109765_06610 [Mesobacillus thioparans]